MGPGEIINSTFSLYQQYSNWRQFNKDTGALLRLLYLESMRNINLISTLNFESKNIRTDDDDFKKISLFLETDILNLVFLDGKKSTKLFSVMNDISQIKLEDEEGDDQKNNETTLNALVYLYVKIWILKKLVSFDSKGKALKPIRYRARLQNITSIYHIVADCLRNLDEITPLLTKEQIQYQKQK